MIKCADNGDVIVEANSTSYNLADSQGYADFLLWITTPAPSVSISKEFFKVSDEVSEDNRAKAERYSEFLLAFAERRTKKLAEEEASTPLEQREKKIEELIARLKSGKLQV